MKFVYDLHTHSCLSPCGDNDMTPNNIVNMAALCGIEILALTDHNSAKNTPAAVKAGARAGVLVIPGMELCVSEEAHIVCLFERVEAALEFGEYIYKNMPHIKNRQEIFGEQRILDEDDALLGYEENLLITAADVSVNEVKALCEGYGGTAFPAHIDRDSYSVIASLGSIPEEAGFKAAEVTCGCDLERFTAEHPEVREKLILRDSDSHYLETLGQTEQRIDLPEKSAAVLIAALVAGKGE